MPTDLHPAEIVELRAKTVESRARTVKLRAEARKAEADAEMAEGNLAEQARRHAKEAAENKAHRVIDFFNLEVTGVTADYAITRLHEFERTDPGKPIEIVINSPGGSITDGFALVDAIRRVRANGTPVNITALGMAASMGGVILQAATTRRIGKHSVLLLHEGSMGAIGDIGKVEDRVAFVKEILHPKILALFAERSAEAHAARPDVVTEPLSADDLKERWARRDWWITAEDALRYGLVDEVV